MGARAAAVLGTGVLGTGVLGVLPAGWDLARTGRLQLRLPAGFDLDRVARSHGWCALAPCAYDPAQRLLHRTLALPDAGPLTVRVDAAGTVSWGRARATAPDRAQLRAALTRMLCLDADLEPLHAACDRLPALGWVRPAGAGRLLRGPDAFEDLARTLATTNCSWAGTVAMVRRLVDTLGAHGPAGERAFPTAAALAAAGPQVLRKQVRVGYRAEAFAALAAGWLADPRAGAGWENPTCGERELTAALLALRGFGRYAAEGMLGLLGRPRGLALDSWIRAELPRRLGLAAMSDEVIAARYAPLGPWAGTGLWLELTSSWFATGSC